MATSLADEEVGATAADGAGPDPRRSGPWVSVPPSGPVRALIVGGLFVVVAGILLGGLRLIDSGLKADLKLPIILIVGTGCLLLTLGILAVVYSRLGLADGRQPLGLPE